MTTTEIVQLSFDYAVLDPTTKEAVILHRDAIKNLMRRTAQDIWDIGQHLVQVKDWLGHGQFTDWIEKEFGMSDSTARKFMSVFKSFKTVNFTDLDLATSALYLIASPSTPDSVRTELISRAESGETIAYTTAKQAIAAAKGEESDRVTQPAPFEVFQQAEPGDLLAGVHPFSGQSVIGEMVGLGPGQNVVALINQKGQKLYADAATLRRPSAQEAAKYLNDAPEPPPVPSEPKFKVGDLVRGIDLKDGGVIEGVVTRVGNKYLGLESDKCTLIDHASVLERAEPEPSEGEDSPADPPDEPEETHAEDKQGDRVIPGFNAGELVAGFYNPTTRYEVGTLELDCPDLRRSHYSIIITAAGDRCGVVSLTLRAATDQERDQYYGHAVETTTEEEGVTPQGEPEFKAGDRVSGVFIVTGETIVGEFIGRASPTMITVRSGGKVWGLEPASVVPAPEPEFIAARTGTDEHYTPEWVWKPALEVVGTDRFGLDPASNSHHSPNVPAETVYTIEDDGLSQPWEAESIWVNPPFSRMEEFAVKANEAPGHLFFLAKCDCRPAWFEMLCELCTAFVLIHKSVKFLGNDNSSFFGVVIFYRGPDPDKFFRAYSPLGTVCQPLVPELLGE
ncbi:MAG: DUF3102 domain-containing protein [Thermosynechococcaceae cyanobacterium MS004]|nr:DUF3102 domain-containing protein [Thermosynechococcaceae cyanobacterium MS004]